MKQRLIHFTLLAGVTAFAWTIELIDLVLGGFLDRFGIVPRSLTGLRGILFAPFLHGGFYHLSANTLPFLVLGLIVMLHGLRHFLFVTVCAVVVGGLGTWLIGASDSVHIGASGLIFGYLGFLLARGYFERRILPVVGSIIIGFLYGSMLFGVLPGQIGISWEGHFFGLCGGILSAKLLAARTFQKN